MGQTWIAKPCGSKEKHGQHFIDNHYVCFGYTPIEE